jgi:hypothetical protein
MSITAIELDPELGFRTATWRLQLAKLVAQDEVPSAARRWVDDLVRRAARVFTGHPDPDIQAAIDLHFDGPVIDRAEITARVLAEQPAGEIAVAVGRPKTVIDLFERIAFDVRGQRPMPLGIHGLNLMEPIAEDDLEAVLNRVAVQGGLVAVEAIAMYFRSGQQSIPAPEVMPDVRDRRQVTIGIYRKLIGILIEPVDLLGIVQACQQEAAAGGPPPCEQPAFIDALPEA